MRQRSGDGLSPFERLKLELENVDCITGLFWWEEIRRLPAALDPAEKMELMVSGEYDGEPALVLVTNERLLVVSKSQCDSVRHGTTTRLEARSDWADDVTFRLVHEEGELVLKEVSQDDATRLYCRLHDLGRVPEISASQHLSDKLRRPKQGSMFPSSSVLPDPTALLRQLQHRWVLKAIDETGPRRRSLPWVAHALFMATAWAAALVVLAVIALVITAIVALVIYA
jgi:hypothetical protein